MVVEGNWASATKSLHISNGSLQKRRKRSFSQNSLVIHQEKKFQQQQRIFVSFLVSLNLTKNMTTSSV